MVSIPTISLKSSAGNCRQSGKTSSPVTNESTIISSNSEIKGMKKCYTCIDPGGTHQTLFCSGTIWKITWCHPPLPSRKWWGLADVKHAKPPHLLNTAHGKSVDLRQKNAVGCQTVNVLKIRFASLAVR